MPDNREKRKVSRETEPMKSVRSAHYGRMAAIYNAVTKFISANGNARSQNYFLKYVRNDQNILNIGCGSVGFSCELSKHCRHVTALDISKEMIAIAEKEVARNGNPANIRFVCEDIMQWKPGIAYDVVFANFFLNTFRWDDCRTVMSHIMGLVKDNGILCIADESKGEHVLTKAELIILRPLIAFFHHLIADHPLHPIYDYSPFITKHGFVLSDVHRDKSDYICSWTYRKTLEPADLSPLQARHGSFRPQATTPIGIKNE
jgi:ubiquinone/menaquinone biosynthesis C-methylase UbiE